MPFLDTEKPLFCYGAAVCIALCFVLYLYPFPFLAGHGNFFEAGDAAQHASGSQIFLEDEWHFPPAKTLRLNAPEGISILYTDSIPLAGFLFKLVKPLLPEGFQYIGIWHLFIALSQTIAGVFLLRVWGVKSFLSSVVISCFVLSMPCLLGRMGHTSLMTHSTFLLCFALYFEGIKHKKTQKGFVFLFSLVCALAGLIHPYLFAMCYAIFLAFTVDLLRANRKRWQFTENLLLSLLVCGSILFLGGYSAGESGAKGFGLYSMNLLSPVRNDIDAFLQTYVNASGVHFEGFNYLGLGVLGLFPIACFWERARILSAFRKYRAFIILLILFFVYSLSNEIYLGETLVLEIPVPSIVDGLFSTFRASGRFFWPVGYFCLFFVVFAFFRKRRIIPELVLICALVVQMVEVSPLREYGARLAREPSESRLDAWATLLDGVTSFDAYPAFQPEKLHRYGLSSDKFLLLQRIAGAYALTSNTGYISRSNKEQGDFNSFEKKLDANLYMTSKKAVRAFLEGEVSLPSLFVEALEANACVVWEDEVLCRKGIQDLDLSGIDPHIRPVDMETLYTFVRGDAGLLAMPHNENGWSVLESWGVWTDGRVASLPLELPASTALKLVLDVNFFLDPVKHPSFRMDIFVNGHKQLSRICNAENASEPVEILFSKEELARSQGKMLVKFVFDAPASPAELGLAQDSRKLALGLRKATLQRLEDVSTFR